MYDGRVTVCVGNERMGLRAISSASLTGGCLVPVFTMNRFWKHLNLLSDIFDKHLSFLFKKRAIAVSGANSGVHCGFSRYVRIRSTRTRGRRTPRRGRVVRGSNRPGRSRLKAIDRHGCLVHD